MAHDAFGAAVRLGDRPVVFWHRDWHSERSVVSNGPQDSLTESEQCSGFAF